MQVPAPEQPAPAHLVKVEPGAAVAVRVTVVPSWYSAVQLAPQLIPAGELVTVPLPLPPLLTLRVYEGQ